MISVQTIWGTCKFVESKWHDRYEEFCKTQILLSTSQQKKNPKTEIHYWAWERWVKALINVSTREAFHSTRQKSLGKQLSLVLAFLNKHEHHFKWSELQHTLLSSSCWLRWHHKSVKTTGLGHILHLAAPNLLVLQTEVHIASWISQPTGYPAWRGLTAGRCPRASCCSVQRRAHHPDISCWGQADGPSTFLPIKRAVRLTSCIIYRTKLLSKAGKGCYPQLRFFQLSLFLPSIKYFVSLSIHFSSSETFATLAEVSHPSRGYSLELSNKSHGPATYTCYWIAAQSQISHPLQVLFPSVKIRILVAVHYWKAVWNFK